MQNYFSSKVLHFQCKVFVSKSRDMYMYMSNSNKLKILKVTKSKDAVGSVDANVGCVVSGGVGKLW